MSSHVSRCPSSEIGCTHIAVLGEMTIFSVRGNSFQTWGSSTGFRSMQQQECRRQSWDRPVGVRDEMPETRTAPAKLHVDERARKERKRKRDELGVLAAEDVYHLCPRVDVVCRFLGEAVEDDVRDVDAPCVKLRLDELGEGEEQSEGANEGGNVGNLVAVGHGQRVAGVRPLWWGKTWAREGYANGMGRAALVLGPPRPFGALCTTLRTLRGCALYSSSIAADSS